MDDTLITYGDALKATGDGRIAGYLVRYSDPGTPDIDGEFFTKGTDFSLGFPASVGLYYNHGLDPKVGRQRIGTAEVKSDDAGLWMEAQLDVSNRYQALVYELAKQGRLGSSSGAAAHLVQKRLAGKSTELLAWPLAEASVTVKPADPRNMIAALKSLETLPSLEELAAELKTANLTLSQHSEAVVSAVEGYADRLEARLEARIKTGRVLSAANLGELEEVRGSLTSLKERLEALLEKARPKETEEPAAEAEVADSTPSQSSLAATALFADYQQTLARVLSPQASAPAA